LIAGQARSLSAKPRRYIGCGGGADDEQDSRQPPDKTIGPVQCPASDIGCHTTS